MFIPFRQERKEMSGWQRGGSYNSKLEIIRPLPDLRTPETRDAHQNQVCQVTYRGSSSKPHQMFFLLDHY